MHNVVLLDRSVQDGRMDSATRKRLIAKTIATAVRREPNSLEQSFREGAISGGPPYSVRLRRPNTMVDLLGQDPEVDAFGDLLADLRSRVPAVRVITTGELRAQLLLVLARIATGTAPPTAVEQLARQAEMGGPVVSICEMDGIQWLGTPATLAPGLVLGRVSDGLELAIRSHLDDPFFTLDPRFFHAITEDFQGDRNHPPQPGDAFVGHYPVVLSLSTSDRSVVNNVSVLRRLAAALGGALWIFDPDRIYPQRRPGVRDYALAVDREYEYRFDALIWNGRHWDNQTEDAFRPHVDAEAALDGRAGMVFGLAAQAINRPDNKLAQRVLASLRTASTACNEVDPYDRLLLLVVALEALVVGRQGVQEIFVTQLGKLTDWLHEPSELKRLYDLRSALAHDGLLDNKQEGALLALTHTVAEPSLAAALGKLVDLSELGIHTESQLLAWHRDTPN